MTGVGHSGAERWSSDIKASVPIFVSLASFLSFPFLLPRDNCTRKSIEPTMKSGFYRISERADPEPAPGPAPFPIKIVTDEPAAPDTSVLLDNVPSPSIKRNDEFYAPWEKFLAVEPKRAKKLSRVARETAAEKKAVEKSAGDGLAIRENAARSWEEAAAQCQAKVDAIVAECERLNEKYRDRDFDLEGGPNCLQSLTGR